VKDRQYVLLFDEALHVKAQNKQLAIHIQFWSGPEVHRRYFTSVSFCPDITHNMSYIHSSPNLKTLAITFFNDRTTWYCPQMSMGHAMAAGLQVQLEECITKLHKGVSCSKC